MIIWHRKYGVITAGTQGLAKTVVLTRLDCLGVQVDLQTLQVREAPKAGDKYEVG